MYLKIKTTKKHINFKLKIKKQMLIKRLKNIFKFIIFMTIFL